MNIESKTGQPTRLSKLSLSLRGPRLVDVVLKLIEEQNLTGADLSRRYGVSPSWLSQVRLNPGRSPACDIIQVMFEDLSGQPLFS